MTRLNSWMRRFAQDLGGATARFTPPLDPALNLGYFEYGENEFADIQGEDCDDYIRFTAKAPAGRPLPAEGGYGPRSRRTLTSGGRTAALHTAKPAGDDHERVRRDHLFPA